MPNPYEDTIQKLASLAKALRAAARDGRFAPVQADVESLGRYTGCFFCVRYRLDLEKTYAGVCGNCPCHKIGERSQGRPRPYNGCYVRAPYREMVRMAQWFRTNTDAAAATALSDACEAVIADMRAHESELR